MVEPPYGIIAEKLSEGNVIPFLGAGASQVGRTEDAKWDPKKPKFLPNGRELSHFLARKSSFPSAEQRDLDDLAKVSSYYAIISGRSSLSKQLQDVLSPDFTLGPLHQYLASVSTPLLIVTTNYDSLIEQAFQAAGKPYDLVIHLSDRDDIANAIYWWKHGESEPIVEAPNNLDPELLRQRTVIYKMHGTVKRGDPEWDTFVITEEDYIDFLSRMTTKSAIPPIFSNHFRTRSFLFLGYSLADWNFRVILKNLDSNLRSGRQDIPSWAIQREPSELEKILWDKRNVKIFNMSHDEFAAKMQQVS